LQRPENGENMGEGLFLIDIIIFGMIAAFLVFRLRNVLGRRTGHQGERHNPYADKPAGPSSETPADKGNVVQLPDRKGLAPTVDVVSEEAAGGLTQIKIADPTFDEAEFVNGAEMAFGMIVDAYANGDTATLRPLLADDLYDDFSNAIRARIAEGQTLETRIEVMKSVEIADARLEGSAAYVTIRYVTDQINVTRDEDGNIVDGDAAHPTEVVDLWTYARNTSSDDPNWLLVQTDTPDDGEADDENEVAQTDLAPEDDAAKS
jgi:predicted lipid-binding transport protein (Tim44 family)